MIQFCVYKGRQLLLAVCCLIVLLFSAVAQEMPAPVYTFRHLDISEGLTSNHVSAILRDRKGFIWIASTSLQRYDGTNLVTVATFDRVPGSIYYDDICLCEDRKGRIWMGSPENIRMYDPVTAKVYAIRTDMPDIMPGGLTCSRILEDHNGIIWATTRAGLLRFEESSARFVKAPGIPEASRAQMKDAIMEDKAGNLWVSGDTGVFLLSPSRRELFSAAHNPHALSFFHIRNNFKKFYTDKAGDIWMIGREGRLYRYQPASTRIDTFTFTHEEVLPDGRRRRSQPDAVFDVCTDEEQQVWVATEKAGIFRFNRAQQKFNVNITAANDDKGAFHYDYEANCLLSDKEGHLWIGTDRGINILSLHDPGFRRVNHHTVFPHTRVTVPEGEVTGVFQASNGDVYTGYWGKGFCRFNSNLQLQDHYRHVPGNPQSLPEERNLVWGFAELKDGSVLIGQENGYLSIYDPRNNRFIKHLQAPAFGEQTLLRMVPQHDTAVWIGLYKRGLARWNTRTGQVEYCGWLTDSLRRPTSVMDLSPYRDSLLWLATSTAGLLQLHPGSHQIREQYLFRWEQQRINNVTCLTLLNDSILLAATDHGLWVVNMRKRQYRPLTINGTLFDEWVLSMAGAGQDKIWFTTQSGFYRFDYRTFKVETFSEADEIVDNTRKVRRRIQRLRDGRLVVGASDHFVVFDTAVLHVSPPPPDVTIVTLRAMDSTILTEAAQRADRPVTLTHKQNFIGIEFKSLLYHPEKISYYYRLDGIDENWVNAEGLLVARYTNLPPGHYTFYVKAVNAAGTFSVNTTSLRLFIKPAFWQTGWFRAGCILLAIVLLYLYYRLRIQSIKKEARERTAIQQQMAQLEMKALRAQMNPHFIFNALNSIQIFIMKNETEQALAYLSRFARLIRSVLDNSQLNHIPISKEIKMLENYMELEKLRFTDQFTYEIIIDPELDTDFTEIPTMILQPFVENAIWHGLLHKKERGTLTITFRKNGERILCTIADNGIGRSASASLKQQHQQAHYSRGLQITRDRLSLYNNRFQADASFDIEDIKDEQGEPAGTQVNLWFPLLPDN